MTEHCDLCGGEITSYSVEGGCPMCGAPNCCKSCCEQEFTRLLNHGAAQKMIEHVKEYISEPRGDYSLGAYMLRDLAIVEEMGETFKSLVCSMASPESGYVPKGEVEYLIEQIENFMKENENE